ncbi:MAG: hypothetical protein ACPG5B_05025 [Chitinophagales bacterium]
MIFSEIKEFKKAEKKYLSLEIDLATVKQVLRIRPNASPPISFRINDLNMETCVIKMLRFNLEAV